MQTHPKKKYYRDGVGNYVTSKILRERGDRGTVQHMILNDPDYQERQAEEELRRMPEHRTRVVFPSGNEIIVEEEVCSEQDSSLSC